MDLRGSEGPAMLMRRRDRGPRWWRDGDPDKPLPWWVGVLVVAGFVALLVGHLI